MISIKKQDINYIPFSEYSGLSSKKEIETLVLEHGLSNLGSWLLPQLLAFWGQMEPVYKDGKINGTDTLAKFVGHDSFRVGVWKVCTKISRGNLVKSQNVSTFSKYSALVPLVMAGLKEHKGIQYKDWDQIMHCVDPSLYEAMYCEVPDLSRDRLIEIRNQGLLVKSGATEGQMTGPTKKWALTGIGDTELGSLPKLATTMLTQIWVAHPSLRHPLMVLDPRDWDSMPEPLINHEVLASSPVAAPRVKEPDSIELPW